ncbi:MAG: B12-binding domain-containing radical SAM protein [Candidatus Omnitrophica bacterium]|nr:B12-binding domain-containing radical SAM protein [Candidatus Omnitrophota bacterium]MBU1811381.1 B12-binding domain-containing radical SAM protein [Candidatus Omnitrophota bacterium]
MKVVFIHQGRENLGIEYLSSILKKAGHQTRLLLEPGLFSKEDNVFHLPFLEKIFCRKQQILKEVQRSKPDLVAFSVYTSTYLWACETAKAIKQNRDIKIAFGGIHPTLVPEKVIENDCVDFVVVGEGEFALLELVEALSTGKLNYQIDNVWFKRKGQTIANKIRPPIENLDSLPHPDKELFEDEVRYKDDYVILTSRGCAFSCTFCCESFLNKLYNNKYFRRRSIDSVMQELNFMKEKYNFKEVMFFDSILFTDKKWLRELMNRFRKEINVPFRCTGHVNFFDWEIGKMMKESGCYCIDFGVESMSEFTRKNVLKRFSSDEQLKKASDTCDKLKLRYDADLMFGLPGEGEKEYLSTIDFFSHLKYLNRLKCYNLAYYPRTEIVKIAKEKKMLDDIDIENIAEGRIGDWFHRDSIKDKKLKRIKDNFQAFYKILPVLPQSWTKYIITHKLYRKFYLLPSAIVIFIQLIIALRHRDYRFIIYPLNYLHHFRRKYFYGKSNN